MPLLATDVFGISTATAALDVPRRVRAGQGGHQPRGRRTRRPGRAQAGPGRRLARRAARPVHPHPGADVGLGRGRQRPARDQPGHDLVDDRADEDRPRRAAARRGLALGLNEAAGYLAVAADAFLTGRDRRSGTGSARRRSSWASRSPGSASGSRRCSSGRRTPTRCWRAGGRGRGARGEAPWLRAGLAERRRRSIAVGRVAGRSRQQPQRRAGLGPAADRPGGGRARPRRDRRPRRGLSGDVGRRPDRDRCALGPDRSEAPDRGRDAGPGRRHRGDRRDDRVRAVAGWGAILLGLGTAMVYPTLLAVVADVAEPRRRGAVTGVYRFWRDLGFAVGAILVGLVADRIDRPGGDRSWWRSSLPVRGSSWRSACARRGPAADARPSTHVVASERRRMSMPVRYARRQPRAGAGLDDGPCHLQSHPTPQGADAWKPSASTPDIDDALDLDAFEAGLRGSIVLPGSPEYDEARQVNSARADKPSRRSSSAPPMPPTSPARSTWRASPGCACRSAAAATAWPATAPTTAGSCSTSAP